MGNTKLLLSEMLNEGYVILDQTHSNKWKLKCPAGHLFITTKFLATKRGVSCGACAGKDPIINFLKLKISIEAEGWKIVKGEPSKYKRFKYKLLLQNPQGQLLEMTGDSWLRGHRTVRGSMKQKRNRAIEEVKEEFKKEGYECLASIYEKAKTKMEARCPEGHDFKITYNHWQQGVRCSICKGTPRKTLEEIQKIPQILESGYVVLSREKTSYDKLGVRFKCPHDHEWLTTLTAFLTRGDRCPKCNPKSSRAELELLEILKEYYPDAHKSQEFGFELDIYIPSKKIAIEYCGLYWHSTAQKSRNYHYEKFKKCKELGIKLYTVFEDEWIYQKEKVLARLLPPKKVLYAKEVEIKTFLEDHKEVQEFLNLNHLQGKAPSPHTTVALYYENKIVGAMAFGFHHRLNKRLVLQRMCFGEVQVIFGAAKMLAAARKVLNKNQIIITWSDNRWSWGDVYEKLGFIKTQELKPDYSYCLSGSEPKRYSKQSMRKTKKEKQTDKTELELRTEQGLLRIFDCGKIRWELKPI